MDSPLGRKGYVEVAAWLLLATQVIHGATPADTDAEGYMGLVGGVVLLVATITAIVGLRMRRAWAPKLAGWTGLAVAVGFVLYHAVPVKSSVSNPYLGEPVGPAAWISVALAVAAGAWAAYEGLVRSASFAQKAPA